MSVLLVQSPEGGKIQHVGGQAVLEGVMMRSPNSFTVSVRLGDGRIVLREDRWRSIWHRLRFLRWPLLRGSIVLTEAMWNGISSLTFSAHWAATEEDKKGEAKPESAEKPQFAEKPLSDLAILGAIVVSFAFSIGLFVALPHALTALLGLTTESWQFHAVDGLIKIAILVGYVWGISFMPDIRRVFQYHGAEHMAIFTYENDLPLTVENARRFTRFHPRCGTSFLFMVLAISIFVFSVVFPFLPKLPDWHPVLKNLVYILVKIPLLLPIAGISYEITRLSARFEKNVLLQIATRPGVWLQHITTRDPSDDQLEIALLSLKKCLWREKAISKTADGPEGRVDFFGSFAEAAAAIPES